MKACTGTFQSLPGAFSGSKDASESEVRMEGWGRRGGSDCGAKQRRMRRRWRDIEEAEGRAGSQCEAEELRDV